MSRSAFPRVFWVGNIIEILERFAYYGLYMGFQIYATKAYVEGGLGWSESRLGVVQSIFLFLSYSVPLVSGVLADRYGFKKMLIWSYVLYLPGFFLLSLTRDFTLVLAVMVLIAVAAGLFKPLIAGTVRLTTDETNRTLGFGIFYLMVNVGAFFGPMIAGALRTVNWNYSFYSASLAVVAMIVVTAIFYRNPIEPVKVAGKRPSLAKDVLEIVPFLKQGKLMVFILLFGVFIEIPFWSFFNLCPMYVDRFVATDQLYLDFTKVLPAALVDLFSTEDKRIAGETLAHTALYVMIFQLLVTRLSEKARSIPVISVGIVIMLLGCVGLWASTGNFPWLMFAGTILFAIGEMACMPRMEQYLIGLLPPEKTGLGGGLLRIPVAIGAGLSGVTINPLYGKFIADGNPHYIWLVLGGMLLVGYLGMLVYDRVWRSTD
ncbi:MFS transporter [bacterium]|nr:MFS transporter [bacterium]